MRSGRQILIVDNDTKFLEMVSDQLQKQGLFSIVSAQTGTDALVLSKQKPYDAIILEADLPDMDGYEVCKKFRHNGVVSPIIMLVRSDFDLGAKLSSHAGVSDYLKKPIRIGLLKAKLRSHIQCHERQNDVGLKIGPYNFEPTNKLLLNIDENKNIRLTDKETAILLYLYRAGGNIVGRDVLLDQVWDYKSTVTTHTLETHVYRLRKKIEPDASRVQILVTEPGGYRLISKKSAD